MRHATQWGIISLLGLLGTQESQAQPAACGGADLCFVGAATAAVTKPDQPPPLAKAANLAVAERCPEELVDVTAASADERRLACSAAKETIERLRGCAITLRRPLHVQIMSEVRHPFSGAIFGLFDTKQQKVLITQEANIPSLVEGTPFAEVPQRDFYRSLIVHEVVHGVMHQNLKRPATSHATYEYPAYALQIESLAPGAREKFLQSFDQTAITAVATIFSDPILLFDPYFFAARAYHHFKAAANGCAYLAALLEGDVAFIAQPQM